MNHQETVANGMVFLDKVYPGWYSRINLETLDLASTQRCVLGQLEGGGIGAFYDAVEEIDYPDFNVIWLGFVALEAGDPSWEDLTQTWRKAIESRRGLANG